MALTMDYLKLPDDTRLAMRKWQKAPNFKKILLALHGLGVDGKGYGILSEGIEENTLVISVDLRGHGDSEGIPGDIPSYWQYIKDLKSVIAAVNTEYKGTPLYLLGESIGATCAINCSLYPNNSIKGLILLAPALKTYIKPRFDDLIELFKSYALNKDLNIDSTYYKNQIKAKGDFSLTKMTPKFILNLWLMMTLAYYVSPSRLNTPMLIIQGDNDNIVRKDSVLKYYNKIKYRDKELKIIKNATHSLLNSNVRDISLFYINKWLTIH